MKRGLSFRFPLAWLLATVFAGLWCGNGEMNAHGADGPLVGKRAPEFHIQGIFNENYSLEKFKGHILVMQFGASW